MREARIGDFGRPETATDGGPGFEHEHLPSGARESDCPDETVRSRADDDGVVFRCGPRGPPIWRRPARSVARPRCAGDATGSSVGPMSTAIARHAKARG